jgi:hypothetical protein
MDIRIAMGTSMVLRAVVLPAMMGCCPVFMDAIIAYGRYGRGTVSPLVYTLTTPRVVRTILGDIAPAALSRVGVQPIADDPER